MMTKDNADHAAALYHAAVAETGDVRTGCLNLIAAAMPCQHMLRGVMAEAKVEDMLDVLSVASAVLMDANCGGLLDLAEPAGRA